MNKKKNYCSHLKVLIHCLLFSALPGTLSAATIYYIDNLSGKDQYSGLSPEKAWQSLDRVNEHTFLPGDIILFKSGGFWQGQLAPKGSGDTGNPIIIDRYGEGALPLIDGGGRDSMAVVRLFNQSWWEIRSLEITNFADRPGDRRGIEIKAANSGIIRHIHLKDLVIHDIRGKVGNDLKSKKTAGIYIAVTDDSQQATRFDDILVEGCELYNIQNQGIVTNNEVDHADYPGTTAWHRRKFTGLVVRNNIVHHISKNAMIIRLSEGGLVEHNLCYETALGITGNTIFSRSSRNTLFQYNEGFSNKSIDYDGSLYDPDFSSPGTIWQYSYSHDNAHGLLWVCTTDQDRGIEVRNNLSINDRGTIFYLNYPFEGMRIHHNHIYIGAHRSPVLLLENPNAPHTYTFDNNFIINRSEQVQVKLDDSPDSKQHRTIAQNTFAGNLPEDQSGQILALSGHISMELIPREKSKTWIGFRRLSPKNNPPRDAEVQIGKINGLGIVKNEIIDLIQKNRAAWLVQIARTERGIPAEWSTQELQFFRDQIIQKLIRKKTEQEEIVARQIATAEEIAYDQLMFNSEILNRQRQALKESGGIIYGPITFKARQLDEYWILNQVIALKDELSGKEIAINPDLLKDYFEQHQELFNSRKRFSDYRENGTAVEFHFIDEQYELRLQEKMTKAKIELDMESLNAIIRQTI